MKYKKISNNENAIEIDGKVVLSFDPRYKEYLKWKNNNPDLEELLVDNLKQETKNKELYNNGAPHVNKDKNGDIGLLWELVNVPETIQHLLIVVFCEWLRENTTHPLLELVGEQGSGKSWLSRCLRGLIDPNRVPLRAVPSGADGTFEVHTPCVLLCRTSQAETPQSRSDMRKMQRCGPGHGVAGVPGL